MSSDLAALVAGTMLAVGALAFVLYPLFFTLPDREHAGAVPPDADDSAILALRDIEFDRATGKLSDADYAELKRTYSALALRELRSAAGRGGVGGAAPPGGRAGSEPAAPLDDIEARVRAFRLTHRECADCGLRPEPDAIYCSTCGAYLDRACPACSVEIGEQGATFCSRCGATLRGPAPAGARP